MKHSGADQLRIGLTVQATAATVDHRRQRRRRDAPGAGQPGGARRQCAGRIDDRQSRRGRHCRHPQRRPRHRRAPMKPAAVVLLTLATAATLVAVWGAIVRAGLDPNNGGPAVCFTMAGLCAPLLAWAVTRRHPAEWNGVLLGTMVLLGMVPAARYSSLGTPLQSMVAVVTLTTALFPAVVALRHPFLATDRRVTAAVRCCWALTIVCRRRGRYRLGNSGPHAVVVLDCARSRVCDEHCGDVGADGGRGGRNGVHRRLRRTSVPLLRASRPSGATAAGAPARRLVGVRGGEHDLDAGRRYPARRRSNRPRRSSA